MVFNERSNAKEKIQQTISHEQSNAKTTPNNCIPNKQPKDEISSQQLLQSNKQSNTETTSISIANKHPSDKDKTEDVNLENNKKKRKKLRHSAEFKRMKKESLREQQKIKDELKEKVVETLDWGPETIVSTKKSNVKRKKLQNAKEQLVIEAKRTTAEGGQDKDKLKSMKIKSANLKSNSKIELNPHTGIQQSSKEQKNSEVQTNSHGNLISQQPNICEKPKKLSKKATAKTKAEETLCGRIFIKKQHPCNFQSKFANNIYKESQNAEEPIKQMVLPDIQTKLSKRQQKQLNKKLREEKEMLKKHNESNDNLSFKSEAKEILLSKDGQLSEAKARTSQVMSNELLFSISKLNTQNPFINQQPCNHQDEQIKQTKLTKKQKKNLGEQINKANLQESSNQQPIGEEMSDQQSNVKPNTEEVPSQKQSKKRKEHNAPDKKPIKKGLQRQAIIQPLVDNKNMQVITISNKTINETAKTTNMESKKKKSKQRTTKLTEKIDTITITTKHGEDKKKMHVFEAPNKIYSNETKNVINLVKGTTIKLFRFLLFFLHVFDCKIFTEQHHVSIFFTLLYFSTTSLQPTKMSFGFVFNTHAQLRILKFHGSVYLKSDQCVETINE